MRIPIPQERIFVGRETEVVKIEQGLHSPGSLILVRGIAGVGKDTLVAEVMRGKAVQALAGVQMVAWMQGTTDATLRRQLIGCFRTHRPGILQGLEDDPASCVQAITQWLRDNSGWLFVVEDATRECRALFECLPLDASHGRVVVTSKERLDTEINASSRKLPPKTHVVELEPLDTEQSLKIWSSMNLYHGKVTLADVLLLRDKELENECLASGGKVKYVPPPPSGTETPAEAQKRQAIMKKKLNLRERSKDARARLEQAAVREMEARELSTPDLCTFLSETLGNLPLSVRLCGHMLKADGGLQ